MGYLTGQTVEKICKQAVRFMVNEMGAERAMVVMCEDGVQEPPAMAHYGLDSSKIWDGKQVSSTVLRKVLDQGETVLVLDALGDAELASHKSVMGGELRSILSVPLRGWNGEIEGLLYADHRAKVAVFDQNDRARLQELADEFGARFRAFTEPSPTAEARAVRLANLLGWAVVLGVLGGLVRSGELRLELAAGVVLVLLLFTMLKRILFPLPSVVDIYADGSLDAPRRPRHEAPEPDALDEVLPQEAATEGYLGEATEPEEPRRAPAPTPEEGGLLGDSPGEDFWYG